MSTTTEQRPPQVTLASGIVMFSSLLVLLTAWERVSTLGSLESQQAIRDVLAEAPFSSLDLSVDGASQAVRIMCMVAAVGACATAILGWYVRKPDRPARLGLTIAAAPVFLSGLTVGGLAGSFVAAGAVMLWVAPAREWFATGRWTPPKPADDRTAERRTPLGGPGGHGTGPQQDRRSGPDAGAGQGPMTPPPATRPFGEHRPVQQSPYGQPLPHQSLPYQPVQQPLSWQQRPQVHARPGAMVAAFVLTVVTAGGLLAMSLIWVAIAGLSPEFLMNVLEQQRPQMVDDGLTLEQLRAAVFALAGAFIVWCGVALTLAGFAMARRDWARRGLMMSAAFSAGACLVLLLSTPLVLIPAAAAIATVVCLRRGDVRRWFALDAR